MAGRSKRLHVLAHRLGLSDDEYRAALGDSFGVTSSKDLTDAQAGRLAVYWQRLLDEKPKKYDELLGRPAHFATPRQLRKVDALWHTAARHKTAESLQVFLWSRFGVAGMTQLRRADVQKVIAALEAMVQGDGRTGVRPSVKIKSEVSGDL
jgi:hypothetical protein